MAKVRRISKESKKCLNHCKSERERALVHNANERARYHNTKEQLMMLSMYVPGEDKESVHDTLSRIRLFNLGLEHFKSNLEGGAFNEFTVDEKLSFSSFVAKRKASSKGSSCTPKKVKKKRPHVVRISSHSEDSDENHLIQTLQRLFLPCPKSEEETMHPETIIVSQHKLSQNMENFEFSDNPCSKSVFIEEKHDIYPVNSFFQYQDKNYLKDTKHVLADVKKSGLPMNNFIILKYKECELYLEDYENDVSCDDSARSTVYGKNKIASMKMEPAVLKHHFDSKSVLLDNLYCGRECDIQDLDITPSSTKFHSYQPTAEKFVGSDLDIGNTIQGRAQKKPWKSVNENLDGIQGHCLDSEKKKSSEFSHVFETHEAEFKKNEELSGKMMYNSMENAVQPCISGSKIANKAIGMTVPLVDKEQKINGAVHKQFTFYYPTSPEDIGDVLKE